MRKLLFIGIATALTTGCIVYDEELVYEDEPLADGDDRPDREERPNDTGTDEGGEFVLFLDPAEGAVGDIVIVSLLRDGGPLPQVSELQFFGDGNLAVIASQDRGEELILTIDIPPNGAPGDNHLLVDFADGSTTFVEDAFTVF